VIKICAYGDKKLINGFLTKGMKKENA